MGNSIERVGLTVGAASFALGPLESLDDLREQVLRAARTGGGFLNVTTDGGLRLSFFVTATTSIVISVSTVPLDAHTADGTPNDWRTGAPPDYQDDDLPYDIL